MTGEYAGHVVENDLGFTVYGPLGQRLVALPSLAAARTALEDFSVHPVTGPAAIADRSSGVPISSAAAPSSRFHGSLPWSQTKKE